MKAFLAFLAIYMLITHAHDEGAMKIKVDGQDVTVYVVSGGTNIDVTDNSYKMNGGSGVNFATIDEDNFTPDMYYNFFVLGKRFSYTVDNSNVGCSCNSAAYFVSMPGYGDDQQPWPSAAGTYYCDANKVGGNYCPEFDISEANTFALQTTAHRCIAPRGKHYDWCEGGGCGQKAWDIDSNSLCPDSHCTINSKRPYRHSLDFHTDGSNTLIRIGVTLEQDGQTVTYDACTDAGYLKDMTSYFAQGMVYDSSLWGNSYETMKWLDGDTGCSGDCNLGGSSAIYSDFEVADIPSDVKAQ